MSPFSVVLAPAAESDISDAILWYRERNALAADGFRAEVFDIIEHIADAPLSRPADEDGNRHRVLKRFPYSVFYDVIDDTVTIIAVAHHRRRPNYWRAVGR
ncbi:type II toxin-antitoxin system RelE/ParE family toxin [Polaromonas sp.]|uniref:type II toxin-antitoxin system RelE/ParE family toxin n=1 Tax=Polaromonas sp. TaxID=1869339 RepID=UPI003267D985